MSRFLSLLICIAVLAAGNLAFAPARAQTANDDEPYMANINIADRVKNQPHMIAPNMEYIASASFTMLHIAYNVFLHPELTQDASMSDLNPERILAEERMVSESRKLCANHLRANECYVFLWTNMSLIPPGDADFMKAGMAGANGIFRMMKNDKSTFNWRNIDTERMQRAYSAALRESGAKDYEPYQRNVRASHRFLEGAKMVGEDMEFISAESLIRMHVLYHIYLYPKKMRVMQMDELSEERLETERDLVTEAAKLCMRYDKADKCVTIFWDNLAEIPLDEKQNRYENFLDNAAGYYVMDKKGEPQFTWNQDN